MVESAKEIVKMFAPTEKDEEYDYYTDQGCMVGSALFMGP